MRSSSAATLIRLFVCLTRTSLFFFLLREWSRSFGTICHFRSQIFPFFLRLDFSTMDSPTKQSYSTTMHITRHLLDNSENIPSETIHSTWETSNPVVDSISNQERTSKGPKQVEDIFTKTKRHLKSNCKSNKRTSRNSSTLTDCSVIVMIGIQLGELICIETNEMRWKEKKPWQIFFLFLDRSNWTVAKHVVRSFPYGKSNFVRFFLLLLLDEQTKNLVHRFKLSQITDHFISCRNMSQLFIEKIWGNNSFINQTRWWRWAQEEKEQKNVEWEKKRKRKRNREWW